MSDLPPAAPSDQFGGAPGEPSEEEVREYLAQMRTTPAEQVVAEVLQGLLNAAQIKLGRRDARLLLDVAADVTERAEGALSPDLRTQLGEVLTQLRMGQVQAEQEVASSGHDEPNDLGTVPSDGAAPTGGDTPAAAASPDGAPSAPGPGPTSPGGPPSGGPPPDAGGSPLDKLWIPGR